MPTDTEMEGIHTTMLPFANTYVYEPLHRKKPPSKFTGALESLNVYCNILTFGQGHDKAWFYLRVGSVSSTGAVKFIRALYDNRRAQKFVNICSG